MPLAGRLEEFYHGGDLPPWIVGDRIVVGGELRVVTAILERGIETRPLNWRERVRRWFMFLRIRLGPGLCYWDPVRGDVCPWVPASFDIQWALKRDPAWLRRRWWLRLKRDGGYPRLVSWRSPRWWRLVYWHWRYVPTRIGLGMGVLELDERTRLFSSARWRGLHRMKTAEQIELLRDRTLADLHRPERFGNWLHSLLTGSPL